MKEFVLRLLYCEMLGHEVEFGYVHALTLTQSTNIVEKKVGYLAVSAFLHKDHPLMIMTVSSFHRDLSSDNFLVVCAALTTMGKLITPETVPTVVTIVINLLEHPKLVFILRYFKIFWDILRYFPKNKMVTKCNHFIIFY